MNKGILILSLACLILGSVLAALQADAAYVTTLLIAGTGALVVGRRQHVQQQQQVKDQKDVEDAK